MVLRNAIWCGFLAIATSCATAEAGAVHTHYQPQFPPEGATAENAAENASPHWIFDRSLYSNDPATGKRVEQYAQPVTPHHDPNAIFDSPHGSYPFGPDPFGPYNYFNNRYPYGHHQNYGVGAFSPAEPNE